MKRLLSMVVLSSITALATWGARRMLATPTAGSRGARRGPARQPLET